jgi:hypothetical protein
MIKLTRARAVLRAFALGVCLSCSLAAQAPRTALAAKHGATKPDAAEVTFLGYQALPDGRGLLFVELSRSVEVEVSRSGAVVEYKLVGARVPLRNNKNPLLLRDFTSSALSAVLVPSKRGKTKGKKKEPLSVRLVLTLRDKVEPTHRLVAHGKGARLEIELPAPTKS